MQKYYLAQCFVWVGILVSHIEERAYIGWGCFRMGCRRRYLGL